MGLRYKPGLPVRRSYSLKTPLKDDGSVLEVCTGMGTAGIPRNPRVSCGYGSECCGNTAGMDLAIAGFLRDGFFFGRDPARIIDKFGCKKLWSAYSI